MNSRNQFLSFRHESNSSGVQSNSTKENIPKSAREIESNITISRIEENDYEKQKKETGFMTNFNRRDKFLQTKDSVSGSFHHQDNKSKSKLTYADLKKNKHKNAVLSVDIGYGKQRKQSSKLSEYSDDELMNLKCQKRNEEIYRMLRKIKICVVPESRIKPLDNLPHFTIILDDLKKNRSVADKFRHK